MGFPTAPVLQVVPEADVPLVDRQLVEDSDEAAARQQLLRLDRVRNEAAADVYRIGASDLDGVAAGTRLTDHPPVEVRAVENRFDPTDVQAADVADPLGRDLVPHVLLKQGVRFIPLKVPNVEFEYDVRFWTLMHRGRIKG